MSGPHSSHRDPEQSHPDGEEAVAAEAPAPPGEAVPKAERRGTISQWLQYFYFLRFSLTAWFLLPALVYLDGRTGAASLTRGIMTVDSRMQAFFAAFFIVALQMTVLITARNILDNGRARFRADPPPALRKFLTSPEPKAIWISLLVAHLPTLLSLWYLGHVAAKEQEQLLLGGMLTNYPALRVYFFLGLGVLAALGFWYLLSLFYYWTYRQPGSGPVAIIFPAKVFGDIVRAPHPPRIERLESRSSLLLKLTHAGFAKGSKGPLFELHFLSAISLGGYFALYLFLYPFTAPVIRTRSLRGAAVLAALLAIAFVYAIANANTDPKISRWARPTKLIFMVLPVLGAGFFVYNALYGKPPNLLEMAFPAFASILVLVTFGLWAIAGLGFLLDRYRAPVLTLTLLAIVASRYVGWGDGERFYDARTLNTAANPPSPAEAFGFRSAKAEEPLIIVTASGGGIHAAAWTALVMAGLESAFAADGPLHSHKYSFHGHLLLASGVSGGSVGLMPYLLEYAAPAQEAFRDFELPPTSDGPQRSNFRDRVTNPPACSSLEAIAWGMEYYDLYRLLFDALPAPTVFKEGSAPDRSWALTHALHRNLRDAHCFAGLSVPPLEKSASGLTLDKAAKLLRERDMPAFTFNTTAEETGGRFLMANYQVPPITTRGADSVPSESFLQAYAEDGHGRSPTLFADLPLATAARLSATFPYVSSGTRLPTEYDRHAYHFLDGGYFDNDGTASVIEFLKSALDAPSKKPGDSGVAQAILLVEIRDGGDLDQYSDDDLDHQDELAATPWTSITQLMAPAVGLWNAGHVSISRRNRRELCLLESTYKDKISLHHIVFTIKPPPVGQHQPLSWKLTVNQRKEIDDRASALPGAPPTQTQTDIQEAVRWVASVLEHKGRNPEGEADLCTTARVPHVSEDSQATNK